MMRSTVSVKANLRQMLMLCSCGQLFNSAQRWYVALLFGVSKPLFFYLYEIPLRFTSVGDDPSRYGTGVNSAAALSGRSV
jgi:hypothetical protein